MFKQSNIAMGAFFIALSLIPVHAAVGNSMHGSGDLIMFRAIEDKEVYRRNPAAYDRLNLPPRLGVGIVYVERVPALTIKREEIESVLVEKRKRRVSGDREELIGEMLGSPVGKGPGGAKPAESYYEAAFLLNEQGAQKVRDFSKRHERELFVLRLRRERIGVGRIFKPIESSAFAVELIQNNLGQLKKAFSPIKEKVTWK